VPSTPTESNNAKRRMSLPDTECEKTNCDDKDMQRDEGDCLVADEHLQQASFAEPMSISFDVRSKGGLSNIKDSGRSGKRPSSHDTNLKVGCCLCVVKDANHNRWAQHCFLLS
jgi:hypothetical protein